MKQSEIIRKINKVLRSDEGKTFRTNIEGRYTFLNGIVFGKNVEWDAPEEYLKQFNTTEERIIKAALERKQENTTYHTLLINNALRDNIPLKEYFMTPMQEVIPSWVVIRFDTTDPDLFCDFCLNVFKLKL